MVLCLVMQVDGAGALEGDEVEEGDDVEGAAASISKAIVTDLSDSSTCPRSEKHKALEAEANLASLLLAKEPFSLDKIVPEGEDVDYGYFEKVMVSNPKV